MIAVPPKINPILKIFDPTIFPTEMLFNPRKAERIVTANSGADVPNATIVNPMTSSETRSFLAIRTEESTSKIAPFEITKILIIIIIISLKISILESLNFLIG